jgi:nucleoside-diphosphate-sugar epimerase
MTEPRCVAVTGASGFVGRHLCDHFKRRGWTVRALMRNVKSYPFVEPGIENVLCDLPDHLDESRLSGVDALVHCAYMTRFVDLASAQRVNDLGTRRILDAGRRAAIKRFLFISTQSAHEGAESYYGKSKLSLEQLFGTEDVIFRSGLVLGRSGDGLFHRMCGMLQKSKFMPLFGGGHQPLQTVHVDDFCTAAEHALTQGVSGRFTLAHPAPLEMRQFLGEIASRLGVKPVFVPLPIAPALFATRAAEALHIPLPFSSENLLGLCALRADDSTADLARLNVVLRDTSRALDDVLGPMKLPSGG